MNALFATVAAVLVALIFSGCGAANGDDVVYLHVIHAYAGGGSVSVYGPSGTIAQNLNFGEAEGPVAFDRSTYQGQMNVELEGVPGLVQKNIDLYSLYPGEHATVLIQRRSGYREIETSILRHHQLTIDNTALPFFSCAFELRNAMSLTDEYTDGRFDFMPEWRLEEARYSRFYDSALENNIPTECGPLPLSDIPGGDQVRATRQEVHDAITNQPWFFTVQANDSTVPGALAFVKGFYTGAGGQVTAWRPTAEYLECLSGAVQIQQDPNAMMTSTSQCGTGANGEPTVPRNAQGGPLVTVDAFAISECLQLTGYSGSSLKSDTQTSTIYYYNPDDSAGGTCNQDLRLRTHSVDSIFDPTQAPTRAGGKLVQLQLRMPKGTWQHAVVYGRPISPLVYMFTSDDVDNGLAEDWSAPEYPNDIIPPAPGEARVNVFQSQ